MGAGGSAGGLAGGGAGVGSAGAGAVVPAIPREARNDSIRSLSTVGSTPRETEGGGASGSRGAGSGPGLPSGLDRGAGRVS